MLTVILLLTKLLPSLSAVQALLNEFSVVSYYKINASKSQILGINVPNKLKVSIQQNFLCSWAQNLITYLGIKVPVKTELLYTENFKHFLEDLPQELAALKPSELSTSGRIAALAMMVLPTLMYLFFTIVMTPPAVLLGRLHRASFLISGMGKNPGAHP